MHLLSTVIPVYTFSINSLWHSNSNSTICTINRLTIYHRCKDVSSHIMGVTVWRGKENYTMRGVNDIGILFCHRFTIVNIDVFVNFVILQSSRINLWPLYVLFMDICHQKAKFSIMRYIIIPEQKYHNDNCSHATASWIPSTIQRVELFLPSCYPPISIFYRQIIRFQGAPFTNMD